MKIYIFTITYHYFADSYAGVRIFIQTSANQVLQAVFYLYMLWEFNSNR